MNRGHFLDGRGSGCRRGEAGLGMSSTGATNQENSLSKILSQALRPNSNFLHSLLNGDPSPNLKTRKSNVTFQPSFLETSVPGDPQALLQNLTCSFTVQSGSFLPAWETPQSFEALGCRDFSSHSSPGVELGERDFVTDCFNTVKECTVQMSCNQGPGGGLLQNCRLSQHLPICCLKQTFFHGCPADQVPDVNVLACVYGGAHSFLNVVPRWGTNFSLQGNGGVSTQRESVGAGSSSDFSHCTHPPEPPSPKVDFAGSNSWEYSPQPLFSWSPSEFQQVEREFSLLQPGVPDLGSLTPDQDNGYSSLEEEQLKVFASELSKAQFDGVKQSCGSPVDVPAELTAVALELKSDLNVSDNLQQKLEEFPVLKKDESDHVLLLEPDLTSEGAELEENEQELVLAAEVISFSPKPVCQNKLIADILGYNLCNSSEDSDSDDDDDCSEDYSDSEEDDGFDSEGTYSDSDCSSADSTVLKLWNSFTNNTDPYDLFHFTAKIQTGQNNRSDNGSEKVPKTLTEKADTNSADSERLSDSISASSDDEDDAWEGSSTDDSENLKLWNTFNNSQDPYNPFNFKAKLHTGSNRCQGKLAVEMIGNILPLHTESSVASASKEVDCLSNGSPNAFKDESVTDEVTVKAVKQKKVTFIDKVTEYYVCIQEDRKGPWEEMARDRCRFQKRVQEVEVSISHCLTAEHRRRVLQRLF